MPANAVRSYVLKPVAAPWSESAIASPCALPMLVLGPASETADALCRALAAEGHRPWRLLPGTETRALDETAFEADFSSPTVCEDLRGLLRASGTTLGGLISVLGLAGTSKEASDEPSAAKVLFLTLKALEQDLKESAPAGGWLINLTALDGRFGLGQSTAFSVAAAGTLGVAKSATREWPQLRVKCIDLDPALAPDRWTDHVLKEFRQRDTHLEIGFTPEGRWRLELEPWIPHAVGLLPLEPDAVLLATGGAYGITADIALALARKSRLRLVLVGRSSLPEPEAPRTSGLTDPDRLRRFLIEDRKATHGKVKPAEVEAMLKWILKERQIRTNLDAFRNTGAEVEYHALDVRDAEAFGGLIDDIYARWGRIDGVLHGAGVIDDKLIRDKTPASFDTVYRTKVVPAEVLARKLRPETLKFVMFFSSIAGRFGNIGQCDYSAGNEVLNKLAGRLNVDWPDVHTVSINWGPWDSGMMTEELRRLYASRNIQPIPVETGVRYGLEVLEGGASGEPELLITASLEQIAALGRGKSKIESLPSSVAPTDAEDRKAALAG
jgi:NAD(P)-dependent dehydrogenase (short-subunit alcohol dehydrogenase family)